MQFSIPLIKLFLKKWDHITIHGSANNWIKSFPSNIQQIVSIFIKNLVLICEKSNEMILYADNTNFATETQLSGSISSYSNNGLDITSYEKLVYSRYPKKKKSKAFC